MILWLFRAYRRIRARRALSLGMLFLAMIGLLFLNAVCFYVFENPDFRNPDRPTVGFGDALWNSNGAALSRDRARNGPTNPPSGISGEFATSGGFELVDRQHQSHVPILNKIQECQTAVLVTLGNRND